MANAKGERNKMLAAVARGRLTFQQAEAWARERGQAPLARRPDTSGLDPMQEEHWTLPMAAAWFIWRSPAAVKDQWNPARMGWTQWLRVGRRGWHLKNFGRASLDDVLSQAGFGNLRKVVGGSNGHPDDNPRGRLKGALVSGKLTAVRIWPGEEEGEEVRREEWPRLFDILEQPRPELPRSRDLASQKPVIVPRRPRSGHSSEYQVPRADDTTTTLACGTSEQRSTLGEASPESEEMLAGLALPIVEDDADLQPFVEHDADLQPSEIIREDEFDFVMSREQVIEAEKTITRAEFERTVWGIEQVVGWVAYQDEAKFRSLSKIDFGPPNTKGHSG